MSSTPLVSVIVPVYNAERYLRQTLDSICNQTLKDIEIILVDDGSTDDSLVILQEYAAKDSRIVILHQQNQYAGVARNNGMARARGKFLIFLDADDIFESELVKTLYDVAEEEISDIAICEADMFDDITKKTYASNHFFNISVLKKGTNPRHFNPTLDTGDGLFVISSPGPWNKLFRREFVEQHSLQWADSKSANDLEFVSLALAHASVVSGIDKVLVHYRISAHSISHTKKRNPDVHTEAFFKLKKALITRGLWKRCERSFNLRFCASNAYNLRSLSGEEAMNCILSWDCRWEPHFELFSKDNKWLRSEIQSKRFYELFAPSFFLVISTMDELEMLIGSGLFESGASIDYIIDSTLGASVQKISQSEAAKAGRIYLLNLKEQSKLMTQLQLKHPQKVYILNGSECFEKIVKILFERLRMDLFCIYSRILCTFSKNKKARLQNSKQSIRRAMKALNYCLNKTLSR